MKKFIDSILKRWGYVPVQKGKVIRVNTTTLPQLTRLTVQRKILMSDIKFMAPNIHLNIQANQMEKDLLKTVASHIQWNYTQDNLNDTYILEATLHIRKDENTTVRKFSE